jgi:hypothetical protein
MKELGNGIFGGSVHVELPPEANIDPLVHRLNLFPVMHLNFFHMIFNLIAVTPLLERFESEYGTLVTLALFTGRKHTSIHVYNLKINERQLLAQYQVGFTHY